MMSPAWDYTLNKQLDTMTERQKTRVLNNLIHTAMFQAELGDTKLEQEIRREMETQK